MNANRLYVGTHHRAQRSDPEIAARGIYVIDLEPGSSPSRCIESPQPGWLTFSPGGRFLYCANEVSEWRGQPGGAVSAFAVDGPNGIPQLLNSRATPALPCHCVVDATGQFLLVTSYAGETIQLFPIQSDGSLGEVADAHRHVGFSTHPRRQTGPHPHGVTLDPANQFVFVPDLGTDRIEVYRLDASQKRLLPRPDLSVRQPAQSGPRHIAFASDGRNAYVINEMSARVVAYGYDARIGQLIELQSEDLLPAGFSGHRSGAEVGLHPNGQYLYATTRSHGSSGMPPAPGLDQIVWFEIHPVSGRITLRGRCDSGGAIPRSLTFDPTGQKLYVAHQGTGTVVEMQIDSNSGTPMPTGRVIRTPVPVCIAFGPAP